MTTQAGTTSMASADARPVDRAGRLRFTVTLSLAASAGIHAALVPHHAEDSLLSGLSFAAAALAMLAAAAFVALRAGRAPVAVAAIILSGAIVLYAASMFTPVPGVAPHVEPPSVVGGLSKLVELTGLAAAAWLLLSPGARPTRGNGVAWLFPAMMTVVAAAYATRALGH